MNWDEAVERFNNYLLLEKAFSKNSIEAYIRDIGKFVKYGMTSELAPETVTAEDIDAFLVSESVIRMSKNSQARMISSIRAFFKYLVYDELIPKDPSRLTDFPRKDNYLPTVLSVSEIERMLNSIPIDKPEGQRNKAIIETLYSCGLRVSELVNLKISNINFRQDFLRIKGKGNKERILPLGKMVKKEIKRYLKFYRSNIDIQKKYEDFLFLNKKGSSLSRMTVFNIVKQVAADAGIRKNISPHTLRHSFASHLVNGGADLRSVQDMLGHKSILTTEIYTHLDETYLKDTLYLYHPRSKYKSSK